MKKSKSAIADVVDSAGDPVTPAAKPPHVAVRTITVDYVIRGMEGSPLVVHNFGEKAKKEIRDKQQKKSKPARDVRRPEEESEAAKYFDSLDRECVPVTALKKAIVSAAPAFDDITKVGLRQALFVFPTGEKSGHLVPIFDPESGSPHVGIMREDAVTIGIATRGLAYRPEYTKWLLRISVEYNPRLLSKEQLDALVDQAGWGVGICEGRPERTSALGWGRFERVIPETEPKA